MQKDSEQHGRLLRLRDGIGHFGPVSDKFGEMEVERPRRPWQSIRNEGYLRQGGPDGDVKGQLLTDSLGEWCVLVRSGKHRVAIAAALGYDAIPNSI